MAFTEQDKDAMDLAASQAHQDLDALTEADNITFNAFIKVGQWWQTWYMTAGHKRLARILLDFTRETVEFSE